MTILKMPNTAWSYKHTCGNCTAELEVEKSDVKYHNYPGDQREAGYDTWDASCPVCKVQFSIPASSIPKPVQVEIKQGKLNTSTSGGGGYFDR
jgi:hypothetical protein